MSTRIVIVGGGAGGLELATSLGRRLGKRGKAEITLIDRQPTHLWKPLLHEVATGALDSSVDQISYRAVARQCHFQFVLGTMAGLDRTQRQVRLEPILDEDGSEVLPERRVGYDYLVLALGSVTNDFDTPGVADHCRFLDTPRQAERFHTAFMNLLMQADQNRAQDPLLKVRIPIVGGGATGVELSAELVNAIETAQGYGFPHLERKMLELTLLEAGPRLLPALPERISRDTRKELEKLGVNVRLDTRVTQANPDGLIDQNGEKIPGDLMVWAAGVKGPEVMTRLDGLGLLGNRQLPVNESLQSPEDPRIFALGDCAACPQGEQYVPPRAQSAHQMASHLARNLPRAMADKPLTSFVYKDHGSLVSLSQYSAVGTLMGSLAKGSLRVEGTLAKLMYVSLYRMHQIAIYGWVRGLLIALTDRLHRAFRPKLKLH